MFEGREDCEFFLWGDELGRWLKLPPPKKKKKNFFLKSQGEKIERKRRKIKMDVGGGGDLYIFYAIVIF